MTTILLADRRPTGDALVATATSEVLVASAQAVGSRGPFSVPGPAHFRNLRRGVRYRVLVPDAARTGAFAAHLTKLALAGADVRTVPEIRTDAIVIDRTTVLYPAEHGAAPFRLPGVVTTAVEHFERVWATAVPLLPADSNENTELGDRERELLTLLAAGRTDAAMADELGISVRTVRRSVAAIMNRLGARSRFMAGVKAAYHGWLIEPAGHIQRKVA